MHSWKMANSDLYHSERWGESFSYEVPLSLARDSQHTLILKFSECYFWEPGMKVFDIKVGDSVIAPNVDPFLLSGAKLMPGDLFIDVLVKGGQLYIGGNKIKNGVKDGQMELKFAKGKADNPKINGIVLVEGDLSNTHHASYFAMKKAFVDVQVEKEEARAKAEQFFAEDAYDYEERIDGRGPFNKFLTMDWALEVSTAIFLMGFFNVILPKDTQSK